MNIFNILIAILAVIILYIILKKYNSKKNEKFTTTCSTDTASLTDWEKLDTEPTSGGKLTNSRWNSLKTRLSESDKDIVSFSFRDDLFKDMNDVEYYKIDINDYLEINKDDGSTEYWKPIKKWKDGVVSHFCKELCILKLGYEWIKVNDIINLSELSTDIGNEKTNSIRELIKNNTNNEYAKLDETILNNILGSYYINDNNYIVVDGINYKVAANIPIGRKWKVYGEDSYISSEKDVILTDLSNSIVSHFNNLVSSNIGDIIILSETEYLELFESINLTEKYVIHPNSENKCFMPELFEYDTCYDKSCAIFANKEFDDYTNLVNLRQSSGYKTTSFEHTIGIMDTSDNQLLNLVNQLQQTVGGDCSYSLLIDKLIENIRVGDYVKNDDSIDENCPKTYDPHTYIIKPTLNIPSTYDSICNDLDVKEYRTKINPEIYKYITEEWIQNNRSYTLEDTWNDIKDNIDLSRKDYNDSLNNKIISKNQLSELIAKYLDDVEYFLHENYRKPVCIDDTCHGSGIIIQNPNTRELMDSTNKKLNENDVIDLYSDEDIYHWEEVYQSSNSITIPSSNLGVELSNGTREFTITEWNNFDITTPTRYDIFEYEGQYYQYMGLLPRYIKMGNVSSGKYVEITNDNIHLVNITPDSNYITKSECNDQVIDMIKTNYAERLDIITELTDTYYESLLTAEKADITRLKTQILNFNNDINTQYDSLCEKYNSNDYKLYSNYNIIKFTKNTSLDTSNKINLSNLAQKTIKLKEISIAEINKKFNEQTEELVDNCTSNECRDFGNITDQNIINILDENTVGNIITISLNDFSRLISRINILENDYISVGTTTTKYYKILSIYDDNIVEKIDSDFSIESYPDVFNYTYNDFISINIDLHRIDINSDYYIMVDDKIYDLNIDDLFERFILNYKSVYQGISNINLTNHEKCLNNQDELLFANKDAIAKEQNSCTTADHSCKENSFENEYTKDAYDSMGLITEENKQSWIDNNFLTDYDDTYKLAIGYDITESLQDNTHANYWKNRYHNEEICPPSGTGKPEMDGGLYNVNPEYNYGLKWKKLPDHTVISSEITIIEIYDYDVIDSGSLDSDSDIIDLTSSQNNIRFKNSQGIIINMSQITTDYYLMIKYVNPDESEFINYYEVFGSNKCSGSQICSTESNRTYIGEFNTHVENIYNDRENCSTLNIDYADRYDPAEQTSFDKEDLDFESLPYNPNNYDSSFTLYIQ